MEIRGSQWIAGQESRQGSDQFPAVDPSTGEMLEPCFLCATDEEVDQAGRQAEAAYIQFRDAPLNSRAELLEVIGEEILKLGDILVEQCMRETALPRARIVGERGRTVNQLKMFADEVRAGHWMDIRIDTALPRRTPVPRPDLRMLNLGVGPVAVFCAGNFPLAFSVAGGDTASALAAGCPVVVKAHSSHPGTAELVARAVCAAVRKCGMPAGTFSMVHGPGPITGQALVRHPAIKAVGFTGSLSGGTALLAAASERTDPIPVFAEMGSINPVFLLPGALAERSGFIAKGLATSVCLGVGQFCTNPGLVVGIRSGELDHFTDILSRTLGAVSPASMLNSRIHSSYLSGIRETSGLADGVVSGSGQNVDAELPNRAEPVLMTASSKCFLENPRLREEVFGPSTLLVMCETPAEMISIADKLRGQLTATLHAEPGELESYRDLISILSMRAGRLIVNGFPTGVEVCHAMTHGGPFPASTDSRFTSVGTASMRRFLRPVCFQDFPEHLLPEALRDENHLGLSRRINGNLTRDKVK